MGLNVKERAERREKIAADLKSGKSIQEVVQSHGVSYSMVYSTARTAGIGASLSIRKAARARDFGILCRILRGNDSYAKIAADMGCSQDEVWEIHNAASVAGIPAPVVNVRRNNVSVVKVGL